MLIGDAASRPLGDLARPRVPAPHDALPAHGCPDRGTAHQRRQVGRECDCQSAVLLGQKPLPDALDKPAKQVGDYDKVDNVDRLEPMKICTHSIGATPEEKRRWSPED